MKPTRSLAFLLVLPFSACQPAGPDEVPPTVDCDEAEVLPYEEVSMWPECTGCHSADLTGAYRQGAPEGVDFDSYEAAQPLAEDAAIEVYIGNMPFTGTATDEQREELYAWAMCGTP